MCVPSACHLLNGMGTEHVALRIIINYMYII